MQGTLQYLYWVCGKIGHISTKYAGEFALFILSWVCSGIWSLNFDTSIHFYTEYAGEFVTFILSMRENLSYLYWVCRGICYIDTEYAEEFVILILSMWGIWSMDLCPLNKLCCILIMNTTNSPHTQYKYEKFSRILSILWTIPPHNQCAGECCTSHPVGKLGNF